jgi:hypothetical protein
MGHDNKARIIDRVGSLLGLLERRVAPRHVHNYAELSTCIEEKEKRRAMGLFAEAGVGERR